MCPALGFLNSTLNVMPTMMCQNTPTTPTESDHSSFWTTPSRSSSSSPTSVDSRKTITASSIEQAEDSDLHNPPTLTHAPPDEHRAQLATRPTPDILPSDKTINPCLPPLKHCTVNPDHCLAIIQTLDSATLDFETFSDVTPADYNAIVGFLSEHLRGRKLAKLIYNADLQSLVAMAPYEIHEVPFQHLSTRIHQLLARLSLDDGSCGISWKTHFNLLIGDETSAIIPDMHLDLRPRRPPGSCAIKFWVGECGFSSLQGAMERQLMAVAAMVPELDVAITVSIRERKPCLPPLTDPLHSLPALPRSAFVPALAPRPHSLEPVVVENITWLDIRSIVFRVFLRRSDGTFDFKKKKSSYAQGTLFPNLQMDDVDNIFNKAAERLILQFARMMEEAGTDHSEVARLREKAGTAFFSPGWSLLLEDVQHSLYDTAYSRYLRWMRSTEDADVFKRKADRSPSPDLPPITETLETKVGKKRHRKKKHRSCK